MSSLLLQINDASDLWLSWLLLSLAAFLLGALLGWMLTRGDARRLAEVTAERDRYHTGATKWEKDYQGVKYQLEEAHKMEADLRATLQSCEADRQMLRYRAEKAEANLTAGAAVIPESDRQRGEEPYREFTVVGTHGPESPGWFEDTNLRIIRGIDEEVEELLREAGYRDWAELAAADADDLRAVLARRGGEFAAIDPATWPRQARLAVAGDWDSLRNLQRGTTNDA
ncbi:hypothetical protein [Lewinella sp. JB7]|uniref:hypothetical protein n=1 Tax=Lewinella sp. JB7 TaxID=2962887 RepID=UPI0020CA1B7B|nr:hypothetical protein [Lewinella sp. JB7]MCP9235984.1 hypothetical protein [Lewinella sp. JB7]